MKKIMLFFALITSAITSGQIPQNPFPMAKFTIHVQDEAGNPIQNAKITFQFIDPEHIEWGETPAYTFPTVNTGKDSPDNATLPGTLALAYKGCLGTITTPIIVYSYTKDSVIGSIWGLNNTLFKPQGIHYYPFPTEPPYEWYFYDKTAAPLKQLGFDIGPILSYDQVQDTYRYFSYPDDQAEAKAYADYSLTNPIGGMLMPSGYSGNLSFYDEYDNFMSFDDEHSPEFTLDIQNTSTFYTQLLGPNNGFGVPGTR